MIATLPTQERVGQAARELAPDPAIHLHHRDQGEQAKLQDDKWD